MTVSKIVRCRIGTFRKGPLNLLIAASIGPQTAVTLMARTLARKSLTNSALRRLASLPSELLARRNRRRHNTLSAAMDEIFAAALSPHLTAKVEAMASVQSAWRAAHVNFDVHSDNCECYRKIDFVAFRPVSTCKRCRAQQRVIPQ